MGLSFDFDDVDAFTVGAVGKPGQRVFLLQARRAGERVTVKCEKQQAAAIAEHLRTVLNDLPPAEDKPMPAAMELAGPIEPAFVLGRGRARVRAHHRSRPRAARRVHPGRRRG